MKQMIVSMLNDEKKIREIRNVLIKNGIKVSSSMILSVIVLLTSASSNYEKSTNNNNLGISYSTGAKFAKRPSNIEKTSIERELVCMPLTYEEKVNRILSLYNLTMEQLDVCCAIACAEANGEGSNYDEARNVINTAYNRIISKRWVSSLGNNIYEQLTAPNQFVVYQNGNYKKFLGRTDLVGYQAVIDFLSNTSGCDCHNYLSFRANGIKVDGSVMLVKGGNNYFNILTDDDKLEDFRVEQTSYTLKLEK